jgi:hypothetical protein
MIHFKFKVALIIGNAFTSKFGSLVIGDESTADKPGVYDFETESFTVRRLLPGVIHTRRTQTEAQKLAKFVQWLPE